VLRVSLESGRGGGKAGGEGMKGEGRERERLNGWLRWKDGGGWQKSGE
jgi:hypothetical protein